MNFDSLPKAIVDFWQFLLDPIITLGLCALIIFLLLRDTLRVPATALGARVGSMLANERNKKLAKSYGLDKLLPLAAILIVISVLHLSLVAARFVGDAAPPTLVYRSDRLIMSVVGGDRLVRLWAYFPQVEDIGSLSSIIMRAPPLSKEEREKFNEDTKNWNERAGTHAGYFVVTKFLVVLTLVCLLVGLWSGPSGTRWRTFRRSLVILFVLGLGAAYFGGKFFYAVEQSAHDHVRSIEGIMTARGARMDDTKRQDIERRLDAQSAGREDWWDVRFIDQNYSSWVGRTFLQIR
jgi:hypothetical protein